MPRSVSSLRNTWRGVKITQLHQKSFQLIKFSPVKQLNQLYIYTYTIYLLYKPVKRGCFNVVFFGGAAPPSGQCGSRTNTKCSDLWFRCRTSQRLCVCVRLQKKKSWEKSQVYIIYIKTFQGKKSRQPNKFVKFLLSPIARFQTKKRTDTQIHQSFFRILDSPKAIASRTNLTKQLDEWVAA